jgi:hypothetical protein
VIAKRHCYLARQREVPPSLFQFKQPSYPHWHNRHIQARHHQPNAAHKRIHPTVMRSLAFREYKQIVSAIC